MPEIPLSWLVGEPDTPELPPAMLDAATAAVTRLQSGSNDGCVATRSLVEAALETAGVAALNRRIAELESSLRPFAQMDRAGCDLSEIACERGVASDLTIITSGDFRRASDVLNAPIKRNRGR